MKSIWIILVVLSTSLVANESAHSIIEKLKVDTSENLFFQQERSLEGVDTKFISTGTITVSPTVLILETVEPYYDYFELNSSGVYTKETPEQAEPTLQDIGMAQRFIGDLFRSLFSSDTATLLELFDIDQTVENEQWTLILTPKKKNLSRFLAKVELCGEEKLNSITTIFTSQDSTTLTFSQVAYE